MIIPQGYERKGYVAVDTRTGKVVSDRLFDLPEMASDVIVEIVSNAEDTANFNDYEVVEVRQTVTFEPI